MDGFYPTTQKNWSEENDGLSQNVSLSQNHGIPLNWNTDFFLLLDVSWVVAYSDDH